MILDKFICLFVNKFVENSQVDCLHGANLYSVFRLHIQKILE